MFYTFSELDPIDIFKLRKVTTHFLTDADNKKLRCTSFRHRRSSIAYWTSKQSEELEFQVLYQPDLSRDTPEPDSE